MQRKLATNQRRRLQSSKGKVLEGGKKCLVLMVLSGIESVDRQSVENLNKEDLCVGGGLQKDFG